MKYLIYSSLLALAACGSAPVPGKDGSNGLNGTNGANGINGAGCAVAVVSGQSIITCPDGTQSTINNGMLVTPVHPCPNLTSVGNTPHEYMLRIDGILYGVEIVGGQLIFVQKNPGNYSTRDGRGCNYTIGADYSVFNQTGGPI